MRCSRALMWSQVLVSSVALVACSKGSNATPRPDPAAGSGSAQHPAVAPSPKTGSGDDKLEVVWDRTEPFCPRDKGPRKTSARLIGVWIRVIPQEHGYALQYRKPKAAHEINVFNEHESVIETIPGDKDPGGVISFDKAAWYTAPCAEGTCDAAGLGHDLMRIDRATGKSEKLYGPENAFVYGQPFGDYFYWASSGVNGATGALRRVPRNGTKVETLWEGGGVASVLFTRDVALVADHHALYAVPIAGGKPTQLLKDLKNAAGIAAEGQIYILDRGEEDVAGRSNGRVLVVDRATGKSSVLATDLPSPTVLAVDGDRLDIAGEGHGNIISVPRTGGKPTLLIPAPSTDWSCHTTRWIRADTTGLRWLRMNPADKRGGVFFIPREMLADPIKQWRELIAKQPQADSSSDEPSGNDPGVQKPKP
jgi:hypothetical protein